MAKAAPRKTPLIFFRTASGSEPVREWLKGLQQEDRKEVGLDLNLVALHAFIKKTQKTPDSELAIARKRLKELTS